MFSCTRRLNFESIDLTSFRNQKIYFIIVGTAVFFPGMIIKLSPGCSNHLGGKVFVQEPQICRELVGQQLGINIIFGHRTVNKHERDK